MSRKTSYDELYTILGAVVLESTGRKWWRKGKIQAQRDIPYATILLTEAVGTQDQNVENVELDESSIVSDTLQEVVWNTAVLECRIEFFRSVDGDTALGAATRLRTALHLNARWWDLWLVAGLSGAIRIMDVSGAFRADVEPRAEVRFSFYANVADPPPLEDTIAEISTTDVTVTHVNIEGEEFETVVGADRESS